MPETRLRARRRRRGAAVIGLTVVVTSVTTGCHSPVLGSKNTDHLVDTGRYEVVETLVMPKTHGLEGCGAQALAAVLAYEDPAVEPQTLADELPWHSDGATPVDILLEARARGYGARIARGTWDELEAHVRGDEPVLVMLNVAVEIHTLLLEIPTPKAMHWAVVSGMADDGSQVLLGAYGDRHNVVEREDFMDRWARSDYCLIIVTR